MQELEKVIEERIRPIIHKRTEELLGVSLGKLEEDITERLKTNILEDINIDFKASYRTAKKRFIRDYLVKVLLLNLGNISEVARVLKISRRSLHRMIAGSKIDVKKIKKELRKPYDIKITTLSNVLDHVLKGYKEIIHPDKLQKMYSGTKSLSEEILKELPIQVLYMKDALGIFERRFFISALQRNSGNISKAAKEIGLRFETLHRKIKRSADRQSISRPG